MQLSLQLMLCTPQPQYQSGTIPPFYNSLSIMELTMAMPSQNKVSMLSLHLPPMRSIFNNATDRR